MSAIVIPPSEPELVEPEGDADGVDDFATVIFAVCSRYEEFSDRAQVAADIRYFYGVTQKKYVEAAGRAAEEHENLGQTARRVARACSAYADTLRDLGRDYDDLVERKRDLDSRRTNLIEEINAATEVTEGQEIIWRISAGYLKTDYATLVTDHDAFHEKVRDAEDLVRSAFEGSDQLAEAVSEDGGSSPLADGAMDKPGAPGDGSSPEDVAAWWEGLSEEEREAVTSAYPDVIGSTDGLPASARDDANRILLEDDLARLGAKEDDGTIDPDEEKILSNAGHVRDALKDADSFRDPLTDELTGSQLWLYKPGRHDGDGEVAIAIGNLDTADDVAVFTPGIKTDVADTERYTGQVGNLYESTRYNGDNSSVATLFYLGYDAPSGISDTATATEGRAKEGGENLANAIDGLRASRSDDPAHLTAIGHSYGSTTTAYAVGEYGAKVDDVVLIGSPGSGPAENASDLGGKDHVYVGRNSRDGVGFLGNEGWISKGEIGLGTDPSSENFDGTRFEAEDTDRGDNRDYGDSHGSYLETDSESLYNLGKIVDGHGDDVNEAEQSYDPAWRTAVDPEWDRDPTKDVPGRSRTSDPG